jgi:2,3-bisphosphoglycerate-independent phosphoglycerate mutase
MTVTLGPTALIILDGFGYSNDKKYNAIAQAKTPTLDMLWNTYPHAILTATGTSVGLPDGYIGNSQIGHRILGAGRIVEQPLTIVNNNIHRDTFHPETLTQLLKTLKKRTKPLHIMGLLSDAGVHSHIDHLIAFIRTAYATGIHSIILHLFLDGRDTAPQSALMYIKRLKEAITPLKDVCIGSAIGRFYAMDRDENWNRTQCAYRALTSHTLSQTASLEKTIKEYYLQGITDEFIPSIHTECFQPLRSGDGLIFFNFRPDRARQLTQVIVSNITDLTFFITPFSYGPDILTNHLFELPKIEHTLKDILIHAGKRVFSIAETEKYAHITYFFSGGDYELAFAQSNILIPSLPVEKYVEHPCMSANDITQTLLASLGHNPYDFYLVNYANADMVAHSGNFEATIAAIECLDKQIKELYEYLVLHMNGTMYITADHGNAELMYNEAAQQVHTAHTHNPVPFMMVSHTEKQGKTLPLDSLYQVAPFILKNLHMPIPKEMCE